MDSWTDERLDDLATTLRPLPVEVARNTETLERMSGDILGLREELREGLRSLETDIGSMRTDLSADIGSVRTDLSTDIGSVRTDLSTDIGSVRTDLSAMQRQMAQIGWGLAAALVVALVTVVIALA